MQAVQCSQHQMTRHACILCIKYTHVCLKIMKGPRKREASQPAYGLRFWAPEPSGALEDGARGWDFF